MKRENEFEPSEENYMRVMLSNAHMPGLGAYVKFSWRSDSSIPDAVFLRGRKTLNVEETVSAETVSTL